MFVVINKDKKIVGYHLDEDVVFEYVVKYNKYSKNDEVTFEYIKNKKFHKYIKHNPEYANLYLLRYRNTYVPERYIDSESLSDNGFISEIKLTRDTIDTLMSCYDNFNDKQLKQLMKAYNIINNVILDAENYTPDMKQMMYNKDHISELTYSDKTFYYDI